MTDEQDTIECQQCGTQGNIEPIKWTPFSPEREDHNKREDRHEVAWLRGQRVSSSQGIADGEQECRQGEETVVEGEPFPV